MDKKGDLLPRKKLASFVACLFWVKLHESQAAYFDPGVVMELLVFLPNRPSLWKGHL